MDPVARIRDRVDPAVRVPVRHIHPLRLRPRHRTCDPPVHRIAVLVRAAVQNPQRVNRLPRPQAPQVDELRLIVLAEIRRIVCPQQDDRKIHVVVLRHRVVDFIREVALPRPRPRVRVVERLRHPLVVALRRRAHPARVRRRDAVADQRDPPPLVFVDRGCLDPVPERSRAAHQRGYSRQSPRVGVRVAPAGIAPVDIQPDRLPPPQRPDRVEGLLVQRDRTRNHPRSAADDRELCLVAARVQACPDVRVQSRLAPHDHAGFFLPFPGLDPCAQVDVVEARVDRRRPAAPAEASPSPVSPEAPPMASPEAPLMVSPEAPPE